ncbi:MAG: FAD-binding oxidoreductase, partial [Haloferacaceae archaeon]
MATEGGGPDDGPTGTDPAADARAEYDYRGEDVERPGLVADLRERVAGDVRFDTYTRQLYATDASAYEVTPIGVVFPASTEDVRAVVAYCADREIPLLPRGGGTSLAGQAVNEAVVLDFSRYMDGIERIDPEGRTATARPGVRLGDLNAALEEHGLKFAPDPAWGDKSVLGGAIGNNSTGSHSLQYGKTDAYVEELEVVLADGTVTTLGETTLEDLAARADPDGDLEARLYAEVQRIIDEEADAVEAAFPGIKRNASGYNLDVLIEEARRANDPDDDRETVNLGRLMVGSEGTLAVVTEATVSLEPIPNTKAIGLLTYDSLLDAMEDVEPILAHDPAAVEVMDDVLLDLARDTAEFADVVATLPEGTDAVLLVEFYADDDAEGRRRVADLVADRAPGAETEADPTGGVTTDAEVRAVHAMEAHDAETRERFWKMRKSGLPILLGRTTDEKHIAFIEDTAVPAEHLPEYVADFQAVLDEHDTFACFYAHAGPGVLHIRPLINTKTAEGVEKMES